MCRRKSIAMQSIEAMCASENMDAVQLQAKSKLLLGSYRRVCWATLGSFQLAGEDNYCLCDEDIENALDYLYSYSPTEARPSFERNLKKLFDSRWMMELVESAMIQVKEFPGAGEEYFQILSKFYLNKYKYCESELLEELNMERSRYYDRKREATLVFGLALWGTVLPKIKMVLMEDPYVEEYEAECI